MEPVRILHLDNDWFRLYGYEFEGVSLEIVPEVVPDDDRLRIFEGWIPDSVIVRTEEALDSRRDHRVVYKPTVELLDRIRDITSIQSFDWIVVGNNDGAGVLKVESVNEAMRSRIIVTATRFPPIMKYEPLGCLYFTPRVQFGTTLLHLPES